LIQTKIEVIGVTRIKWFKEISKESIAEVGGKGANLGEMYNLKLPIPPGFCVTAQTYKEFIEKTGIVSDIKRLLKGLAVENTQELQERANQIQKIISTTPVTQEIRQEVVDAYDVLNTEDVFGNKKHEVFVAVRSSATAEDLPEASFAGQQATYLNIKGKENLIKAIRLCWASLFTARAIYYREKNKFDHMKVLICVVVQKMVNSDQAGVMFTINPATNDKSEIVVEAVHGLGETAVSGAVNPDTYVVDKEEMIIKSRQLKMQNWGIFRSNAGENVKLKIPESVDKKQVIEDELVQDLAKYGKQLEDHYRKPQDVEWAVEKNKLYIVQTRAVTTLKKTAANEEIPGEAVVKGQTASAGVASGPVRVIRSAEELDKIVEGDILVTPMTNPDMVVAMRKAVAIVTDEGGLTSHAAIVSREMGIPCIVGTENATKILTDGNVVTVDATHGKVVFGRVITGKAEEELKPKIPTKTQIKLVLDLPDLAEKAAKTNADGIGLLRLELVIAENGIHPAEYIRNNKDEEYTKMLVSRLKKVGEAFKGKPVWVRTSDLRTDEYRGLKGGDKEPVEDDPMIGWHGIRRSLDQPRILKAEFAAVKKLHELGYRNFGIMIPFVIRSSEVAQAKKILRELGVEPVKDIPFGVMIETPASCWVIEKICKEGISFASFGTNDLTQLTLGIDRNNDRIAKLFDELHPAVLGQIKMVVETCKKFGVETSICGQAGSRPDMARFLVNIGIDSISCNKDAVYKISEVVKKTEEELRK
jgi:pyruvate,water dikinase